MMIELERTFLAKYLPNKLKDCKSKEILDIYLPKSERHPVLRIRKNGNRFEMTKKYPVKEGDASHMHEETIILNEQEFDSLKNTEGKLVHKIRHYYDHDGRTAEINVFQGALSGLVIIDFEFETMEQKNSFSMPDFCLAEVTQEEGLAGGMLCGKSFDEIKGILSKYKYSKLKL